MSTNVYDLSQFQQTSPPLRLTPSARYLPVSATLAINEAVAEKRAQGEEVIHLGFGESSFPPHPKLLKAFTKSVKHTYYAPVAGIPALRQAIAEYLQRKLEVCFSSEQIIVAPGSKPLLYALMQVLEGDLLLPIPSWVSYIPQAHLAGKKVYGVETDATDRHRLTPWNLAQALIQARRDGGDPRILLLNSPSNPTGSMFQDADVRAIAFWAREHGITIISDEIYSELAHGWREHVSPAKYYPQGTVVTGGLSKAFSAGGWRLGYAAFPMSSRGQRLKNAVKGIASEIWSAATTPVQEAAVVAFSGAPEIEAYVKASAYLHGYMADQLYTTLIDLGISCPRPAGGFYLYPDFRPWSHALDKLRIRTDRELAFYLLDHWGIATLPGSEFGDKPENLCLRLSTSMLFDGEDCTPGEQQSILWELLARANSLGNSEDSEAIGSFSLPALEAARERFTEVVDALSHQI